MAVVDVQLHRTVTSDLNNAAIQKNMTNKNPTSDITKHLIDCGVKIISLPGGCVQLLGKYGSILLTHDVTTLRHKHIEQLCGVA
jgi:hypothetical protein